MYELLFSHLSWHSSLNWWRHVGSSVNELHNISKPRVGWLIKCSVSLLHKTLHFHEKVKNQLSPALPEGPSSLSTQPVRSQYFVVNNLFGFNLSEALAREAQMSPSMGPAEGYPGPGRWGAGLATGAYGMRFPFASRGNHLGKSCGRRGVGTAACSLRDAWSWAPAWPLLVPTRAGTLPRHRGEGAGCPFPGQDLRKEGRCWLQKSGWDVSTAAAELHEPSCSW